MASSQKLPVIDESRIQSYMDSGFSPDAKSKQEYYLTRYQKVLEVYIWLKFQKDEYEKYIDAPLRNERLMKLSALFRDNYIERYTVVQEIRKLGVQVEDSFVPV